MLLPCLKNGRIIISYETFMKGPSPTSHPSGMNYKKATAALLGVPFAVKHIVQKLQIKFTRLFHLATPSPLALSFLFTTRPSCVFTIPWGGEEILKI